MKRRTFTLVLGGIALGPASAFAQGDTRYPDHPIRFIVPFAPGGGSDIVTRVMTDHLSQSLGQPVIVENRPGAGTLIGAEAAAKSKPDGYTLFSGITGTMAINPSIYRRLPYDPAKDFEPISMVANGPNVLVVHPSLPVHTVAEFIAYAKAHPGQLFFASSGTGGAPHLAGELMKAKAGIDMSHAPYKGSSQAMVDLLAGHVQVMFSGLGAAMPHIKSGAIRALGVASLQRSASLPEVPTIAETVPGFEASTWFAIFVPAGTPAPIVDKLVTSVRAAMSRPEVGEELKQQGYEVWLMGPAELTSYVKQETAKWAEVIKAANIQPE